MSLNKTLPSFKTIYISPKCGFQQAPTDFAPRRGRGGLDVPGVKKVYWISDPWQRGGDTSLTSGQFLANYISCSSISYTFSHPGLTAECNYLTFTPSGLHQLPTYGCLAFLLSVNLEKFLCVHMHSEWMK